MKYFFFLSLVLFPFICLADTTDTAPLVTQTITYKTTKSKQIYLVWSLNNWKDVPAKQYWPKNTFLSDGRACSLMQEKKDSFFISVTLPKNTELVFMFWAPLDNNGDSINAWDTNEDLTYFSNFKEDSHLSLTDWGMVMPSVFNVLTSGWKFMLGLLVVSALLIFVFRKRLAFSKDGLITGLVLVSLILAAIIRMQMNRLRSTPHFMFGALFGDVLWLSVLSCIFLLLIYLFRKQKRANIFIAGVFIFFLLLSILFLLCNIEVVRILGRPINYQWLYYSDFMTGSDAKNAIAKNLDGQLILNIVLIITGAVIFAVTFSFLPKGALVRINKIVAFACLIILPVGYAQTKSLHFTKGKIENPVFEIISSSLIAQNSSKLFSLKVSDDVKRFIEDYHSTTYSNRFDSNGVIDNVILLVMESTPYSYVSIYDSTYNVTPNLKQWKNISCVYNNVYAHIPATVYEMASINSGVYPLISHISLIANYPDNKIPSISSELARNNWNTALLFSSDLKYSNIGVYAKNQHFITTEDNTSMPCKFKKFGTSNTFIDPLDDKCLVTRYFQWADSGKMKKKFSVLWPNQTHYPYNFTGQKIDYLKSNDDLNNYLNALRNIDEAFGMLMEGLESRGQLKNTLVIVTADHGEAFGTHKQNIHASKIYEENLHVPFIVYNPVFFSGTTNDEVWGHIDIPPTITHLAGIKKPSEWQGRSMLSGSKQDRTFFICPFSDFLFGTIRNNLKYIYNATTDEHELYDLRLDRGELDNIAEKHPEIVKSEFEMIAGWVQYQRAKMNQMLRSN